MVKYLYVFFISLSILCFCHSKARAGVYVSKEDVLNVVVQEFSNQGIDDDIEVEFFGGQTSFSFENGNGFKLLVSSLKYDETSAKFSCNLDVFVDEKHIQSTNLQGRYFKLLEIFVPTQNINKGELILDEMLKIITIRQARIKTGFVVDGVSIIGMEAKKPLKEGKMILARDIGKQSIIKKGDLVSMNYNSSVMKIIAQGQAVSDAGVGDKLELINTKSKKTVVGIVIDKDNVEVRQ